MHNILICMHTSPRGRAVFAAGFRLLFLVNGNLFVCSAAYVCRVRTSPTAPLPPSSSSSSSPVSSSSGCLPASVVRHCWYPYSAVSIASAMSPTRPNSTPNSSSRPIPSLNLPSPAGLEALPLGHAQPCTDLDGIGNSNRHHLPGAEGQAERPGDPRTHAQRLDHGLRI